MLDAQTKAKKLETVDAPKLQQDQQQMDAEIKGKTIDMARELVVHQSDQEKLQNDAVKERIDSGLKAHQQAHDQTMDRAKHGLDIGKAAHDAAIKTHDMVLQTAEAMKPEPEPT